MSCTTLQATTSSERQKFTGCTTIDVESGYVGEIKHNLRDGYGTYTYENSFFRFEGEWKEGLKNGFGKFKMRDGSYYEGEFNEGEINGTGTRYWSHNQNVYEGQFDQGEMNGMGVMKFGNGDQYEGQWADNKMQGEGTFKYANGDVYKGTFYKHKRHGEGGWNSNEGEKYTGGWINNMKHGNGKFHFKDGSIYEGQWKADLMNGEGTLRHFSGLVYCGLWSNDRPLFEPALMQVDDITDDVIYVDQNDVIFSLDVRCLTEDGDVVTESGRVLKITAGIRFQEKPVVPKPPSAKTPHNTLTVEESENSEVEKRDTPFGFQVAPYPICFKSKESSPSSPSNDVVTAATYNGENEVENRNTPTFEVTSDEKRDSIVNEGDSPTLKNSEGEMRANSIIGLSQRTEDGRTRFQSLMLPPSVAADTFPGILSPDIAVVDTRKSNRAGPRRVTESSVTKLSEVKRLNKDLEKVTDLEGVAGRDGSGGSMASGKKRRNRASRQEDRIEDIIDQRFCKPGEYVIIIEDNTESPYLDIRLPPVFIRLVVQPIVRKTKSRTESNKK